MDYTQQSPVILSLCSGMRGIERGLECAFNQLQWQQPTIAAYVEIETFICYNLVKQMEQGVLAPAPVWTDLKTFPSANFHRKLHGIIGGYPCQPFSFTGKRGGTNDPRHLWPYIQGIIKSTEPVFCFFENVPGHINLGYDQVYRSLCDMGYHVEAGLYSAEEVGAPQIRQRLYILAIKSEYTRSNSIQRWKIERGLRHEFETTSGGSNQLSNPNSIQRGNQFGSIQNKASQKQGTEDKRQWVRHGFGNSGEKLPNPDGERLEEPIDGTDRKTQYAIIERDSDEKLEYPLSAGQQGIGNNRKPLKPKHIRFIHTGTNRWPARPGEHQHDWESPRTESRLGFRVNGYNFREDLLRMAGNAVVSQTAEVAFLDLLLNKHFK